MSDIDPLNNTSATKLSTTEQATLALTNAIHDEVYKSGQRLVEAQLTRELGISRGSLREVFRRLAANGLVDIEPNRGAVVKRISRESVMEILTTREVLEGLAASQAASRALNPEAANAVNFMLKHVHELQNSNDGVDFLKDNNDFHQFVIDLSANRTLKQQIEQLQLPGIRGRFFSQISQSTWQRSLREHESILHAIQDGDEVLAEQLMRAHVRRTQRHFAKLPQSIYDEN